MSLDRRNPYQTFDAALIEDFLWGRTVLSAELLPDGKSNTNYKLTLSDDSTCLLRLRSRGDAGRESYVMGLVRELVPVPEEIHRGESWSVFTFLQGALLQSVPQFTDKAAEALARISSLRFESSGWIEEDGSVAPFEFGGVRGYLAMMLQDVQVQSWLSNESIKSIQAIVRRESDRLDEFESESRLVHGDFNPTNILIYQGKVSGILDWEYSHSGTPYMDLGNLLRHTQPNHQEQIGLGLRNGGAELPQDWKERAALADLSSQLEFLTSTRSEGFKGQCVSRIEKYIRRFQDKRG